MAEQKGATEHPKAEPPMECMGSMNNIRHRAEEIIHTL